jgi:hypothetical protein
LYQVVVLVWYTYLNVDPAVTDPAKLGLTVPVPTASVTVLPTTEKRANCPLTGLDGMFNVAV